MENERKQGFFAALKEEVVRGLSPARSRGKSSAARSASPARMLIPRRRKAPPPSEKQMQQQYIPEQLIARSGSLRPSGEAIAPLIEGPDAERLAVGDFVGDDSGRREGFGHWVRGHLTRTPSMASASASPGSSSGSFRHSDLRLLLQFLITAHAASLLRDAVCGRASGTHCSWKLQEASLAQYILQQYMAASGGYKLLQAVRNAYTMGKARMVAFEFEMATRVVKNGGPSGRGAAAVEQGGFVLWTMAPEMWYMELAVGSSKVQTSATARCSRRIWWRRRTRRRRWIAQPAPTPRRRRPTWAPSAPAHPHTPAAPAPSRAHASSSTMGDFGSSVMMRGNPDGGVQGRPKGVARANVQQLKLMGRGHPTGLTPNLLKLFEARPPLEHKPPVEKRKLPAYTGIRSTLRPSQRARLRLKRRIESGNLSLSKGQPRLPKSFRSMTHKVTPMPLEIHTKHSLLQDL